MAGSFRNRSAGMSRRRVSALVGLGLAGAVVGGIVNGERRLVEGVIEHDDAAAFYSLPDPVPKGEPGEIFRSEVVRSAPAGTRAWRVLYHSRDLHGDNTLVSGLIVAPAGDAPATGRPVVSWAHPTTGIAPECAPSWSIDPFLLIEGMHDFLRRGYVIAATDYSGMGAAGPGAYLVGVTAGQNVLDIVRAAWLLPETHANDQLVLWGHSQGGHAALFAGHLAAMYASEFTLRGVAVAAPATDLGALLQADIADVSGVTIGAYAFFTYAHVYGAPLAAILSPAGVTATEQMAPLCLLTRNRELHTIATPLVGHDLIADPATVEPWATILRENTPGAAAMPVPLFVAQGETDTLVRPEITSAFVERQQALGAAVTFVRIPKTGHLLVADEAMPHLMSWLTGLDT